MKALIVWGGWEGHQPKEVSKLMEKQLEQRGFTVRRENSLEILENSKYLAGVHVVVPCWTMGEISEEQWQGLNTAVRNGTGIAGSHGGMGDAFRACLEYQWMVGGQLVGHPYVGDYEVSRTDQYSPISDLLPECFTYNSEQYYMLVDPAARVLAETVYHYEGRDCFMPVVWTKDWGKGRVFYSALGHTAQEFVDYPQVLDMTMRGIVWAAEGKEEARCAASRQQR